MLKRGNKFLAIALATVGVIGAAGVGFATWFVGIQKKSVDLNLSLLVDETQDSSFILEALLDDSVIDIKDTVKIEDPTKAFVTTSEVDAKALSFSLSTLRYKKEAGFTKTVESFTFKLKEGEINKLKAPAEGANKIQDPTEKKSYRTSTDNTYIDFNEVTVSAETIGTIQGDEGYVTYDVSKLTDSLKFKWGTYFQVKTTESGVSPATFYNDIYCKKSGSNYDGLKDEIDADFAKDQHGFIKEELELMKTTLDEVIDLKIVVTANFAA